MATRVHVERKRFSSRVKHLAPWIAGLLLAAGIVVAIVRFAPNRNPPSQSPNQAQSKAPHPAKPTPKTVPLGKDTTAVARQFLKTAVARKDLDAAWKIAGPNIRGGLTHKAWMTGDIPVVPYPIKSLAVARFKIDWSYANQAGLEVALLPRDNAGVKPQVFFILLKRVGPAGKKHWLVDTWVPKSAPLVPLGANG
jgi:hypothetical protein